MIRQRIKCGAWSNDFISGALTSTQPPFGWIDGTMTSNPVAQMTFIAGSPPVGRVNSYHLPSIVRVIWLNRRSNSLHPRQQETRRSPHTMPAKMFSGEVWKFREETCPLVNDSQWLIWLFALSLSCAQSHLTVKILTGFPCPSAAADRW